MGIEPRQSERRDIADRIARFAGENELTEVLGGDVTLEGNAGGTGKHYAVLISRRATLDGVVRVFSKGRIQIYTKGPLGFGSALFSSEENALNFLRVAFVDGDRGAAHKLIW